MTAAVTPLRAGDPSQLGTYRLTGLLGEGGQGAVYLGQEDRDEPGRPVAVKLLHARFSGDPKARSRFAAEVAVAKRVAAFCTARVLDSDVEGDRPYIVSEYIEGPSLSEVLSAGGPRRGTDLDRLAIGTMTALTAIHRAGVVHRDFKPANVLLGPDGPRVIDFGIARALDATGTTSSAAVGTPAYMAPEQISGVRAGPEADVFAWGATMAYAGTGRPAFGQDSIPAIMHRILNLPPDLGDLPEPLREIVADCLSKDPALRPASPDVLARLLNLAGTAPQPDAGQDAADGENAVMLTQGAATAATESARLRPPMPRTPRPTPEGPQAPPWSSPAPRGNGGRPRIGVLASVGGAALIALVVLGSVIAARLLPGDDDPAPETTPAGRAGGTFRMSVLEPFTPNEEIAPSHVYSGGTGRFLVKQLFTGLTELGADGVARNRLATKITPDPACERWTIDIKDGTTFSNGEPVDARAFARGWHRSAAVNGGGSYLMTDIEGFADVADGKAGELSGVRAVSGTRLSVTLTSPDCDFPARLSEPAFMPVPEQAGEPGNETFNTRPVGNGPFTLQEYEPNSSATLVRNETWAFGKTKFDGVEIVFGGDAQADRAAYTAGEVDWVHVSFDSLPSALRDALVTRAQAHTWMIVPFTARGPMKSREARQAVSYAIDRTRIARMLGYTHRPAHGIVPAAIPGFGGPGHCPSCEQPDTARAKKLTEQAGLRPGTEINLYYKEGLVYRELAEALQGRLETALGWKIELRDNYGGIEGYRETLVSDGASGLALFAYGPDYPSAYPMLWPLLGGAVTTGENSHANYSGWKNGQFDDLISSALRTPETTARTGLFKQAEKLALDDMALIPLAEDNHMALVRRDKYVGLEMDYDGFPTVATAALK